MLKILAFAVIGVSLSGIASYSYSHHATVVLQQAASRKATGIKSASHHVASAPKGSPTVVSKPAPTPLKNSVTTPASPSSIVSPKPQPVVVPSPSSNVNSLTPSPPAITPSPPTTPSSNPGGPAPKTNQPNPPTATSYTSTNWSGYFATSGSFSAISASWIVPQATGNGTTTSADVTWVGIGGVSTSDLIQIGTQNIVAPNGKVSTSGFYELLPSASQVVPDITVTPGDTMTASLVEISSGQWTMSLTDTSNGQSYTATVAYASSKSSAEWIEEDPSYSTHQQIPFDNFGETSFTNGTTITNGNTATIAGNSAQPITMVNTAGRPVATPSALGSDGASFSVSRNGTN